MKCSFFYSLRACTYERIGSTHVVIRADNKQKTRISLIVTFASINGNGKMLKPIVIFKISSKKPWSLEQLQKAVGDDI